MGVRWGEAREPFHGCRRLYGRPRGIGPSWSRATAPALVMSMAGDSDNLKKAITMNDYASNHLQAHQVQEGQGPVTGAPPYRSLS